VTFLSVFQTFSFVFFLLFTWNEIQIDNKKVKDFYFHMALSIFVIALSTVVFGGVTFIDGYTDRLGINGVGIGDPNFSALILNSGIAIMLAQKHKNSILRILMILVMIAAMVQTVSITGLICFIIILLCYFLVGMKLSKVVRNVFMFFLIATITFQYYNALPQTSKNASVDLYVVRIEEKLTAFSNKDYKTLTTGRSRNSKQNLEYFSGQPIVKQLVGGNAIPPEGVPLSHNTFIDLLLRFGVLGTIIFAFVLAGNLWKSFAYYKNTKENGEVFLLKLVFLIFSGALSIYSGNTMALWYVILLFL
jgi:hypothetical protein